MTPVPGAVQYICDSCAWGCTVHMTPVPGAVLYIYDSCAGAVQYIYDSVLGSMERTPDFESRGPLAIISKLGKFHSLHFASVHSAVYMSAWQETMLDTCERI